MKKHVIPDVRPISDLRQNMAEILQSIDLENRPVILTKHGRGRYIMLKVDDYNDLLVRDSLHHELQIGIDAIENNDVSDFHEFAEELKKALENGEL